jgi:hypothetical protein
LPPSLSVPPVWIWRTCWAAIVAVGLILKALQSPFYIFNTLIDDQLMVRMAQGFLQGHWSSNYSTTNFETLAKPVGYPIFLAAVHYLPWSPLFSNYLLYLVGAALVAFSWRRISGSRPQATVVLAALVLNPIFFTLESQRVYREIFVNSVGTVAIGLAFVLAAELKMRSVRTDAAPPGTTPARPERRRLFGPTTYPRRCLPIVLAALVGLAVGVVSITKPTWQWLAIGVLAPLSYPVVRRIRTSERPGLTTVRVLLVAAVAMLFGFGVFEGTKLMNQRTYHVAMVEDFSTGSFARMWKLWASVEAGPTRTFVPITRDMRLAVYAISPTAAEMRPWLESPADFWKHVDCQSGDGICNESGPWFEWDLRYAASSTGKVHSVLSLQNYFNHVADDIAAACHSGKLTCSSSPVLATGLPPWNQIRKGTLATEWAQGMWSLVRDQPGIVPPYGPRPTLAVYRLWNSVVPGMSSIGTVNKGTSPAGLYSLLRLIERIYGVANLLLLAVLALGPTSWGVYRIVRRPRSPNRANLDAAGAALLFFVAALIGMGTLALFDAGQGPAGFTGNLYWSDFATPAELCLVFGALASWPVLRGMVRPRS